MASTVNEIVCFGLHRIHTVHKLVYSSQQDEFISSQAFGYLLLNLATVFVCF